MGQTQHDSETPARGQQVLTAVAFLHKKVDGVDTVFLAKRADTKKFLPGVFELPGGHIDFGEEMEVGLAREIMEEFGVDIKVGDPFGVFTYTNEVKGSHSIEVIYFCQLTDEGAEFTLNPEDHSEVVWVAETELDMVYTESKGPEDDEFVQLRRGFTLLRGENLSV
jgi:8-oxo-dGTP diphosphatase